MEEEEIKHIAVFGACGLIGKNICKLLSKYQNIVVHKSKYDEMPDDATLDNQYDYIFFGSGYGQPLLFTENKIETIRINTEVVSYLFAHCLKPDGSFLFVSTSEVYSGAPTPYLESSIGTTTPQHPRACYIEGKRCGEAIVMAHRDKFDAKIARLALAYGEGTKKNDTRVLNYFIEQALTKGEIRLRDKGEAKRTYCYVQDACEMMLDILFKGTQPVYNVGGKSKITIKGLAKKIATETGVKVILGSKGLQGAPEDVEMSLGLVLTEFPRTFVSLDEGLKRTIDYQRKLYV